MAFQIPKIQYKSVDTTGDISTGSSTINDIDDVSGLEVGMKVYGTGIPNGAAIGSIGLSSVTLAGGVQATATTNDVALNFGVEVSFDFPPIEPTGAQVETRATVSESLSGKRQTTVHSREEFRNLKFSFVSPSLFILLDAFVREWAMFGKKFRYFDDKTLTTYIEVELDTLKYNPKKIAPKGVDTYTWEVPLKFRRII